MAMLILIKLLINPFIKDKNIFNAAFAITGTIRRTYKEKLCQELGFGSTQPRRWFRKLSFLYKIIKNKSSPYLYHLVAQPGLYATAYSTRSSKKLTFH